MIVPATMQLLFDRGDTSRPQKVVGQGAATAVTAAVRCMVAEQYGAFRHAIAFRMSDGGRVVARPRVQA